MSVCVLGGGIQGVCLALELASRGVPVDLVEARDALLTGASLHNEGKIHLGFVYANDPSLETAGLQIEGALAFAPLMRRWLGADFDRIPRSGGFRYAVHRHSLLDPDLLQTRYSAISELIRVGAEAGCYLGIDRAHEFHRLSAEDVRSLGYGDTVQSVFATREVAVDPRSVADLLRRRVHAAEGVTIRTGSRVEAVDADRRLITIRSPSGGICQLGRYDHVANCTWNGRLAIDATMGVHPPGRWSFRQKYYARMALRPGAPRLPSTTVVLGGFGDVVDYGIGDLYISWYPVARRGWSDQLTPPAWPSSLPEREAERLARDMVAGIATVLPSVKTCWEQHRIGAGVGGGIIYALGSSDVDEARSELHKRFRIGPVSFGWYHSVDTGKYTTAPLFALRLAERIAGHV